MAAPPDLSLPPRMRHFAWAGLWLPVPEEWRPVTIEGDADKGMVRLGDDSRTRLELVWARMAGKRFNPDKFVKRRMGKLPGVSAGVKLPPGSALTHSCLTPLMTQTFGNLRALATPKSKGAADGPGIDRLVGFAPAARRIVECIYHHGKPSEDRAFCESTFPALIDQSSDQSQRWAFFDCSFTAPAGMKYVNAVLNLGDMRVRVATRGGEMFGATAVVRQVYPGTLALARQPLDEWLRDFAREFRQTHRAAGSGPFGKHDFPVEKVTTKLGPGVLAWPRLRRIMRMSYWRAPRIAGVWVIHDQAHDCLAMFFIADAPGRHQAVLDELIAGLHWAR